MSLPNGVYQLSGSVMWRNELHAIYESVQFLQQTHLDYVRMNNTLSMKYGIHINVDIFPLHLTGPMAHMTVSLLFGVNPVS